MAHVGKTVVHPLSGERLTFLETAATTGGDLLTISIEMAPGGALGRPHVHPRAEEEFEVLSGRIQLKNSGTTRVAEARESVIVLSGADHIRGNPFDDPATTPVRGASTPRKPITTRARSTTIDNCSPPSRLLHPEILFRVASASWRWRSHHRRPPLRLEVDNDPPEILVVDSIRATTSARTRLRQARPIGPHSPENIGRQIIAVSCAWADRCVDRTNGAGALSDGGGHALDRS
jgi:quercetin dioxygenase-like cupin family protein